MKNNNISDISGVLTVIDPTGNKKVVDIITEFDVLDNHYLVYTDTDDEDSEFFNCCIVKVIKENGENVIVEIEDDNEYLEIEKKLQEIIEEVGEL